MNAKQLSDEKIKYLIDNMMAEFYHVDDYWVDVKLFFTEGTYVYHDNGGVYTYSNMIGKTPVVKVKCVDGQSFDWSSNQQVPKEFYPKKEK